MSRYCVIGAGAAGIRPYSYCAKQDTRSSALRRPIASGDIGTPTTTRCT